MTRDEIAAELARGGFAGQFTLEPRDGRIAVTLSGERMAWFPLDDEHRASMARERRVLRLIEKRCQFLAPRVIYEDASGWDVRARVPGIVTPTEIWHKLRAEPETARRVGAALGAIIADQHSNIAAADVEGWLPSVPNWPRDEDIPRIPDVVDDPALHRRIEKVLAAVKTLPAEAPVLVHADLGLHNIAFDPETHDVVGVFDYEGAAASDRHQDFKYLLLQLPGEPMLEAAIAAYEPLTGVRVDRQRVRLYNALAALGFLGFRFGHAPEETWCGRTLAEDMDWTASALTSAGF